MTLRGMAGLAALLVLLAACQSRDSYTVDCVAADATGCIRVTSPGSQFTSSLRIASPNISHDARTGTTTLAVASVVRPLSKCAWVGLLPTGPDPKLAIRIETLPRSSEAHRTLFLDWRDDSVGSNTDPLAALEKRRAELLKKWGELSESPAAPWPDFFRDCLTVDAPTVVRRAIAVDWPASVSQSFAARTGFDLGRRNRALVLHPGTRLCAFPVKTALDDVTLEPASGEICAIAANRPDGGTIFDAMIGRVKDAFAGPKDYQHAAEADRIVRVSSWPEINLPARSNFVLVHARQAPRKANTGPKAHNLTTVIGFSSDSSLLPRVVLQCAGETSAEDVLEDFCGSKQLADYYMPTKRCIASIEASPEVSGEKWPQDTLPFTCFRFQERTLVTAEIGIFVQGAPLSVAVGTTLGDVVDRFARAPATIDAVGLALGNARANGQARGLPERLLVMRRFQDGARPVDFSAAGAVARELPLLSGDALTW